MRRYCQAIREQRPTIAGEEALTQQQLHLEKVMLGLRTREGVDLAFVDSGKAAKSAEEGLAVIRDRRLILTREGMVVADRLAIDLFDHPGETV